jgi:mRNA interferase MazF
VDQIRALDNQRFIEKLGKLVPSKSIELHQKLQAILNF